MADRLAAQLKRAALGGIFFTVALVLAACGPGEPESSAPQTRWAHETSDIPVDPAVTWGRLENGLRYAILPNDTPKNTVSMRMLVEAGSLNERDDQRGVAHFLEHMAFKGSDGMPGDEVVKFLERLGLAFGPDTNASTSFDQTIYQLELPEASDDLLRQGLQVFREYAGRLSLDPDQIEAERGVILSEMRYRNTPGFRQTKALYEFLLPGSRVTNRFPIGIAEVIETAPREVFVDFYEAYYRPERTVLVIVGEVDADATAAMIETLFADFMREGDAPADPPADVFKERALSAGYFSDPNVPTQVQIFGMAPAENPPDTEATRREAILQALGNTILSRRFLTLSRETDAPFLSGSASFFELLEIADVSIVGMTSSPDQWREALAAAEQQLRRALDHGFTQAELREQLANFEATMVDAVEIAETRESAGLVAELLSVVSEDGVFTRPETDLAFYRSVVEDLTVEDVNAAFREMWAGREPLVFVSGNLSLGDPQTEILAAYRNSTQVATVPPEEEDDRSFAYTMFGEPGEVIERDRVEDLEITRVRYDNNVRLNMKVTDFEDETIRISIRIGGGMLELPKDKPGLALLADQAFLSGGLKQHSFDEVTRILAGKTVDLDFEVGSEAFELYGTTDPADLDTQLNLMAAVLTDPGYREEAIVRFRKGLDILYETIDATPEGVVRRDVGRIVRSGDPRFGLPDKAQTTARSLEELAAWLEEPLAYGHMEIGVIGDFDPERMISEVGRTFGALPARALNPRPFDEARKIQFPTLAEPVVLRHEGEADQAIAQVYWPTTDSTDRLRARRLNMLTAILRLRLTEEARRRQAVTYSPRVGNSMSSTFPGYGYIVTSLNLEPQNTERFLDEMIGLARAIADEGITEDEFQRARAPILERFEEEMERNAFWLYNAVAYAQSRPDELEHVRSVIPAYRDMTPDQVQAVARDYLIPERTAQILVLPQE